MLIGNGQTVLCKIGLNGNKRFFLTAVLEKA